MATLTVPASTSTPTNKKRGRVDSSSDEEEAPRQRLRSSEISRFDIGNEENSGGSDSGSGSNEELSRDESASREEERSGSRSDQEHPENGDDGDDPNGPRDPEDGLRAFVNQIITPLELRKRLMVLNMEIQRLEAILPNLEEINQLHGSSDLLSAKRAHGKAVNSVAENELAALVLAAETTHWQESRESLQALKTLRLERDLLSAQLEMENYRHHLDTQKTEQEQRNLQLACTGERLQNLHENLPTLERLQYEAARLSLENTIRHHRESRRRHGQQRKVEKMYLRLAEREARLHWNDWSTNKVQYLMNPVQKNPQTGETEIVMSDRIINLNGAIVYHTADYVCERIHYYNNKNPHQPIFLVIEYCPGGSVMSGYRIKQTMDASSAPVYVIVRSMAASMAADLLTTARHSYVFPNAVVLHHQILSRSGGNLTQQREQVADLTEWWQRLGSPLITAIGERQAAKQLADPTNSSTVPAAPRDLEEWIKMMYAHNSDGDWREFGNEAYQHGWATGVVHRIRQTGTVRHPDWMRRRYEFHPRLPHHCPHRHGAENPDTASDHPFSLTPVDHTNSNSNPNPNTSENLYGGEIGAVLPRLRPMDYYWVYDPAHSYQVNTV